MKSIIQEDKRCYICHATYGLEEHHIFGNHANRKLSEKYGLKVWLCYDHHRSTRAGVHFNKDFNNMLHMTGQKKFEEVYSDLDFRQIFGKNYL